MKTELFTFAQGIAHYGEETNITQQLFNEAYNYRVEQGKDITGSNNVAATALIFGDGTIIIQPGRSNQTRSQTGQDDRNNHAERESLAAVIYQAIQDAKPPFNNPSFARLNKKTIKKLISLDALRERTKLTEEQQEQQIVLLAALGNLSQVITYSEREFCDFQPPQQEGCKTYLDVLAQKCEKRDLIQGSYSIPTEIPSLPAEKMLYYMCYPRIKELIQNAKYQEAAQKLEQLQGIIFNSRNVYYSSSDQQKIVRSLSSKATGEIELLDKQIEEILSQPPSALAQRLAAIRDEFGALPSKQPKEKGTLESPALEILEEIQSQISISIDEHNSRHWIQFDKSLENIFDNLKKIPEILKQILGINEATKKQQQYLNSFKQLYDDLVQLSRYKSQQKILNSEIRILINRNTQSDNKSLTSLRELKKNEEIKKKQQEAGAISQKIQTYKIQIYDKLIQLQQSIPANKHLFNVAVPTPTEQMFLRTQGQKVSELLDIVTAQLSDPELEKAKRASLQSAENEGIIGPKSIDGWELQDVEDKGNCFYDAVMHQMQFLSINQQNLKIFTFLSSIPEETKPRNSLRLFIQEEQFKDEEWADDKIFDEFVKKFPNIILAIVDTRRPDMGFVYYYLENDSVITNRPDMQIPLPNRDIIKIAATGNHFLSVVSQPDINLQQPVDPTQTKPNISVQSVFEQQTSTLVTLGDLNQLPQSQNVLQAIAKSSTKVPP